MDRCVRHMKWQLPRYDKNCAEAGQNAVCLSVCMCVWNLDGNQSGTIRNRCTRTCNIVCTDPLIKPDRTPEIGQSELLYGQNRLSKKVDVNWHLQASWASQPMGCLFLSLEDDDTEMLGCSLLANGIMFVSTEYRNSYTWLYLYFFLSSVYPGRAEADLMRKRPFDIC